MRERFILYKFTTRSRPARFKEALKTILDNVQSKNFMVLVSIDDDDESMQNFLKNEWQEHPNVVFISGVSENKIHAINRDVELADEYADWDILVNMSDDMHILSPKFEDVVRESFQDGLDHFLHLPDGYANERIPSMSIMGRDYYNRFGFIYHPSYKSVWADNEAMDVAKQLGRWRYVNESVFTHHHPANVGSHLWDEQYQKTEAYDVHCADNKTFESRKLAGFPNEWN